MLIVMIAIKKCDALRDLVPFVQLEKPENNPLEDPRLFCTIFLKL